MFCSEVTLKDAVVAVTIVECSMQVAIVSCIAAFTACGVACSYIALGEG